MDRDPNRNPTRAGDLLVNESEQADGFWETLIHRIRVGHVGYERCANCPRPFTDHALRGARMRERQLAAAEDSEQRGERDDPDLD